MIDWFVLLTPLLLLPIFLLFVFVGCQQILGIEEGVYVPPEEEMETPPVTFEYAPGLPGQPPMGKNVVIVRWRFTEELEYPSGDDFPMSFNLGWHTRAGPQATPILPGGELVDHGSIGEPTGGSFTCQCAVWISNGMTPDIVLTSTKSPGEEGFPTFYLSEDLELS